MTPTDNAWLDEIITIGAIELKEYELTEALRKQGVTPALYPTLTPEAKQSILTHIDTVCREAEEQARYSERKIMTLQAIDTKLLESEAQKIQFEVHITDNCKKKHYCAFASDGKSFSVAIDGQNIISRQLNPNKDTDNE